jgi:hypothetical protein
MEGLVIVEISTPSETKKETAGGAGAGIVEAQTPNERKEREREDFIGCR